jgi:Poly(ADP-ribose) polymerase catalytic domain
MTEAIRLASRRETPALLARLTTDDRPAAGGDISGIPTSLTNVVKIADGLYEISFPLTHLKPFQRTALGLGECQILLVRLALGAGNKPVGFCLHLHPEPSGLAIPGASGVDAGAGGHSYWPANHTSSAPDVHFCRGKANRTTYQLGRALWRYLVGGFGSLEALHGMLAAAIDGMASSCIACGNPVGARLLRSTTCKEACGVTLRRSDLEVRLADLRHDPAVVDLLLAIAFAAAASGDFGLGSRKQLDLLPGCPISNASSLIQTLNNLPAVATFRATTDLSASIRQLGASTEELLSWACTNYRGFLASATGMLKIPSMPGIYQFVLADATPERENDFATQAVGQQPKRVVFHGTSLDRLYAIIRQGLIICSGGPLQRHGAALGHGIYTTDEPVDAWSYTSVGTGWPASIFHNVRVLLGCELTGATNTLATAGVTHLTLDPSRLMVRYIFLCPANSSPPVAAHIAPAMLSAFALLRRGPA